VLEMQRKNNFAKIFPRWIAFPPLVQPKLNVRNGDVLASSRPAKELVNKVKPYVALQVTI